MNPDGPGPATPPRAGSLRLVLGMVAGILGFLVAACVGLSYAANDVVFVAPAPDGRHGVAVFTRSFGAPGGIYTAVSVTSGLLRRPWRSPNAFALDRGRSGIGMAPLGMPVAAVRWRGADTVEIAYDAMAKVLLKAGAVDGVTVVYRPVHLPSVRYEDYPEVGVPYQIPGFAPLLLFRDQPEESYTESFDTTARARSRSVLRVPAGK